MIDPKPEESVSEQSQDELEPLPAGLEAPNRDYSDLIGKTVSYDFGLKLKEEVKSLPEKNIHIVWGGTVDSNDVLGVLDGSYSVKWDGEDIGEVLKRGRE